MIQVFTTYKKKSFSLFAITENSTVNVTETNTTLEPVLLEFRTLGMRGKDGKDGADGEHGLGADPDYIAETEQRLTDLEENDGIHNGASYLDYFNLALN